MKKIVMILSAMTVSFAAFAQFSNGGDTRPSSSRSSSSFSFIQESPSFSDFHVTYSPTTLVNKDSDGKKQKVSKEDKYNSISAGYLHNFSIKNSNVFFNLGLDLRFSWNKFSNSSGSKYSVTQTNNFLDIKIPFGLTYKLNFGNVAFAPYIGFDGDIFAMGKSKATITSGGETESEEIDLFKESDGELHRFVFGWHVGAKIFYKKLFVGVGYEGPVSNFYKSDSGSMNFEYCNISLGIAF